MNDIKIYIALFVTALCFLAYPKASVQTLPQNFSNVNIDDYTDAQIKQMVQSAQDQGLNDTQLVQYAQRQGLPAAQVQKLQQRLREFKERNINITSFSDTDTVMKRLDKPDRQNNNDSLTVYKKSKIFGADLFRNSKNSSFQPNVKMATPVNYILGPDDKMVVSVYGHSVANWTLTVSPEGNINIPGAGILNVSGKTIEAATAAIKSKLIANNYAIDRGTSLNVSLGGIRSINVRIWGEVVKPGNYTLSSFTTVANALYQAGGPNDIGSFRNIQVLRNNKIIKHLDLYDIIVNSNSKDDIALRDQDVIHVPPYDKRVELTGEVKIPALFEALPDEKLQDIINFSGGFSDMAYTKRIKVVQVSDQQHRFKDIFEADYNSYIPQRGDKYTIDKILDRFENRVRITGAVFRPGDFELEKGSTLLGLIKKAGGLKEDAFTGHASIVRLNPDNSTRTISFNLADILVDLSKDILLEREDNVTIISVFDLHDRYRVTIKGEVRRPGDFDYTDSVSVADVIIKAGGFAEGASAKRIEVSRRVFDSDPNLKNSKVAQVFSVNVDNGLKFTDIKFVLKPFDIVSVYSLPGFEKQKTVKVEGEVIYPGFYTIQKKDEKISDLIARAGGLTQSADVDGGSLKRNNSDVLGVDKTKVDSATVARERTANLKRIQKAYNSRDTSSVATIEYRNNYVGIELKKILQNPGKNNDLILENGDVLRVPKQEQTVTVNGEVLYPSAVVYNNGKSFKGYVLNAGGFSPQALKRGAYVVYPNGTVKGTSSFLFFRSHPSVKPGSEIFVPRKPEPKGNTGQEILAYTTGLASLGAIILGILSLKK